ncbi:MAG: aldo/keto reductase [Candidatus Methylomirabilota bacterium]
MEQDREVTGEGRRASRREFVKAAAAGAVGLAVGAQAGRGEGVVPPQGMGPFNPRTHAAMPTRNLGRTGYRVGIFGLGGQATIEKPGMEEQAVAIINRAIDLGVNYIDTAAAYGREQMWSQRYIGQVMKERRREVFLTSKTHRRSYDESMRLLETSLKLLHTDHLDLWQLHNVSRTEQLDQIFAQDGAIHALEKAKSEKIVRHVGITGHADPFVLADGLRRYRFDTILMAVNAADRHHLSFVEHLLPLALEQELGIIGMKIPARGRILVGWTPPPLEQQPGFEKGATRSGTLTMAEAMRYTLSLPVSTVIIGCDTVTHVEENARIARDFTPLSERQMVALAAKTAEIRRQALFFRKWEG